MRERRGRGSRSCLQLDRRPQPAVPVALEELARVVLTLGVEKRGQLRIRSQELLTGRPAVVGEVEAPAPLECEVDEPTKRDWGVVDPCGRVLDVKVENRARPGLSSPSEEALVVALDQANRPVDDVRLEGTQVTRSRGQEVREERARNVELADHLARLGPVVTGNIRRELMPVGEIDLPRRGEVVRRVELVGARLVRVREVKERVPVLG